MRKRAERKLSAVGPVAGAGASEDRRVGADAQRLVHELEVHQVELELQNEDLRAARAELEEGLQRYTELFDFAPIGYASLGPRLEIMELNHAAAELFGQERSRLKGVALSQLIADQDQLRLDVAIARADRTNSQQRLEIRLKNGKLVALSVAILEGWRMLVAFEDVTERRTNEERLSQAEADLRRANTRKDEFLAMLSHELRNPLAPIRNCIFLLSNHLQDPQRTAEAAGKSLAIMERQVTLLARLIDDLLDVTRIGRGKVQLRMASIELCSLVSRAVEDQRGNFEAARVSLEYKQTGGPIWVEADPARLTQALTNVLCNAEKFTPPGGGVIVTLTNLGAAAELRVRDTGVGIASDMLDSVFEPFAQAPQSIDRSRGGLGLGLSMVKGLIELHGGTVSLASGGRGLGTEVTIGLPTTVTHEAPLNLRPQLEPQTRRRVLVVEDNEDAADTLSHALSIVGHDVQVAYDGTTALDCARTFCPEVVLCDIGLPGMDGYEVARKFRDDALLRSAFLVALTGYARPEDLKQAMAAGFDEHVAKPPNIDRLKHLLAQAPMPSQH